MRYASDARAAAPRCAPRALFMALTALAAVSLVACGGGSSSSTSGGTTTSLTLSGTAARGAALTNATVEATCATGSGTATSNGTGAYTLVVTNGSLPCVLRVPLGDGTFLHSAVGGTGTGTATVNITPLTELIVAQATGVAPETLFAEFATRTTAVTSTALNTAVDAVISTLQGTVDLSGINPLSTPLVVGDAQDQKIDTVMANLASSGSSISALSTSIAVSSPVNTGTSAPVAPNVALLPADLALKPAAESCGALRSGTYRFVRFMPSGVGVLNTGTVTINAQTLTLTNPDNSTDTLLPTGTCRYTLSSAPTDATTMTAEIVVAQSGLATFRNKDDAAVFRLGLLFPEQAAPEVLTLAGIWNTYGIEGAAQAVATTSTFGSNGALTAQTVCTGVNNCAPVGSLPSVTLSPNTANGGYDAANLIEGANDRLFAYRAGNGDLMTVAIAPSGAFRIGTRQRVIGASTLNTVSRSWDPAMNLSLVSTAAVTESGNKITAATASTTTRERFRGNGATFTEDIALNNPRQGYNYRAQNTATASDSSTATINETVFLPLRGMGATVGYQPGLSSFFVSSTQPDGPWVAKDRLQAAVAPNCAALRTGTIRIVYALPAATTPTIAFSTETRWVDAPTLQIKTAQTGTVEAQLVPNGPCRYTISGATDELAVSPAGVMVGRSVQLDSTTRLFIAFPEQSHAITELAGTWNTLGINQPPVGARAADSGTGSIDAAGALVMPFSYCEDVRNCVAVSGKTITLAVNPAGGFDRTNVTDGWTNRAFAFRSGTGDLMLVNLDNDGSISLWTPQRTISAPAVGSINRFWDVSINANMQSTTAISPNRNTVVAVDAAGTTWTRQRTNNGGGTFNDQLTANDPRAGYTHRAAGSTTASNNVVQTILETTSLGMKGMGISAFTQPLGSLYGISVTQP